MSRLLADASAVRPAARSKRGAETAIGGDEENLVQMGWATSAEGEQMTAGGYRLSGPAVRAEGRKGIATGGDSASSRLLGSLDQRQQPLMIAGV